MEAAATSKLDRRRLARAISDVEDRAPGYADRIAAAYRGVVWGDVIGITGPPGAGKSSLTDALAAHYASRGEAVAVLAVDPSSPFSGGAILGDRIRMSRSTALPNVYMRSLASRGHLGGLAVAALDVVALLSQAGFRRIIVETVGAGQADIDILDASDCVLVVAVPGLGDQIQAAKAGIMEIADVFVINKSDAPGAAVVKAQVEAMLALVYSGASGVNTTKGRTIAPAAVASSRGVRELARRHGWPGDDASFWVPPVVATTATSGDGVSQLADAVDAFLAWTRDTAREEPRRSARVVARLSTLLRERVLAGVIGNSTDAQQLLQEAARKVQSGEASPLAAVDALLAKVRGVS